MDMSGYTEISPAPEELLPDDRVIIQYPLYQLGEWLMAYQVSRLEERLEEDGRWQLLSWQYDPDAPSITFTLRTRRPDEIPMRVQEAGLGLWVLLGIVAAVAGLIGYESGKRVSVWRIKRAAIDAVDTVPTLSAEQKEAVKEAIRNSTPDSVEKPIGWPAALVALAVAIVVLVVWEKGK